ncbi:GNAT family N-acetyltransferase [Antarcticibacterium flavum]|uniref:GNAT family N-acetyltransferase n=1 Tax=Antarcticibacterium flavum TaxID=2058175 RepID=A0A5B7X5I7_9FLAO|nr:MULTISPECIES: GNAT family N-acetyltransferase [Antarcticibacterium]MCM4161542.1 GNAT family N-acetyltransferase [Antarcticibacterium sp. W02-3]QCY69981.1 GNAT family N-acetyltransferase [Antarcticibacterium flavum]
MTNSNLKIRSFTSADLDRVMELLRLNTPQYFNASEEKDLQEYLTNKTEEYFVAEHDNVVIGAGGINYFPAEKTARISWDIIHPSHQRKGIGKQLLLYRLKILTSHPSVHKIIVRTTPLVAGFYEILGFTSTTLEKDYWAQDLDLQVMEMNNPAL